MTITEQLQKIIELLGGSDTPDNLITTKLDSIIALKGGIPTDDDLITTKLRYIVELLGGSTTSSLYTTMISDIIEALGGECNSRLISEQLDVIIELLDGEPFEVTGNPVVCYPIEGTELDLTLYVEPKQEGSGTPSPENIRSISGTSIANVSVSNSSIQNDYRIELDDEMIGGSLDLFNGKAVYSTDIVVFDGISEGRSFWGSNYGVEGYASVWIPSYLLERENLSEDKCCSHFPIRSWDDIQEVAEECWWYANVSSGMRISKERLSEYGVVTDSNWVELANKWAKDMHDKGTPLCVAFTKENQEEKAINKLIINALRGTNTIMTDAISINVKGKARG